MDRTGYGQAGMTRRGFAKGALALSAGIVVAPARARAAAPPPFLGAGGQFTLLRPIRKAPWAPVQDEAGRPVDLAATFAGKVVVLNFWATWCAPCVVELPTLDRLAGLRAGADCAVVCVSVDLRGMEKVGPFWRERGFRNLAIRLDPKGGLMRAFGARGLPTTFVVEKDGAVAGYLEGHADWASAEALALVDFYRRRTA
jgi:thiol-disulfide isomerase/thioredoxin